MIPGASASMRLVLRRARGRRPCARQSAKWPVIGGELATRDRNGSRVPSPSEPRTATVETRSRRCAAAPQLADRRAALASTGAGLVPASSSRKSAPWSAGPAADRHRGRTRTSTCVECRRPPSITRRRRRRRVASRADLERARRRAVRCIGKVGRCRCRISRPRRRACSRRAAHVRGVEGVEARTSGSASDTATARPAGASSALRPATARHGELVASAQNVIPRRGGGARLGAPPRRSETQVSAAGAAGRASRRRSRRSRAQATAGDYVAARVDARPRTISARKCVETVRPRRRCCARRSPASRPPPRCPIGRGPAP